jgi:MFS superfamily sulfate permease-like transporter
LYTLTSRCIGGVGVFLIETGLEVAVGLKEEGFEYNLATLKYFFGTGHMLALWIIPLVLAILLRVITHFYHHQLIFPAYFFVIPVIFYIVVAIGGWDFETLRTAGWVFDVGKNTQAWWKFYSLYVSALSSCALNSTLIVLGFLADQLERLLGGHANSTGSGILWHPTCTSECRSVMMTLLTRRFQLLASRSERTTLNSTGSL